MPNIVNTSINIGSPALGDEVMRDELLTFGGAATVLAGTILARDSVSLKLVPFVKGGSTNQNGVPKAVVTYDVVAAGAGDVPIRAMVSGKVNKTRLIINADGTGVNIDGAVLDQLRAYGVTPVDVLQTSA
jgi:hypothetical protein